MFMMFFCIDDVKDKLERQKDVVKTMYEQLENALHKRDKYKVKIFLAN